MPRIGTGLGLGLFRAAAAASGYDADAQAFFDRVTTAGGTLSTTEKNATNQLVLDMKSAGIWSSMKAIYPMVGASAAACAQNLKSSSFTGSFTSGWTFASTGVTPNGTSAYMDTNFIPSTNGLTYDNNHLSFYSRTSAQSGAIQFYEMGSGNNTGSNNLSLFIRRNTDLAGYDSGDFATNRATFTNTNGQGFYCGTAITTTSKYFKNGTSQVSKSLSVKSVSNLNAYLGAFNENNTIVYYSIRECSFASLGFGLSDAEASNFDTAVQTFNQTLNRQVGAQIVSDADAQAYINRVYTAGGTLTNTEANAVNQLTIDMKAAGIWTAMKAVYPMVGSSAAACAQNLSSSSYTGSFSSGWTFASTGVTPNGTSAFMNTGLIPNTNISSQNSVAFGYYNNGNMTSPSTEMGCANAGLGNATYLIVNVGGSSYNRVSSNSSQVFASTFTTGFYQLSRIVSTEFKYYKNSSILNTASITSSGLSTNSFWGAGGVNYGGTAEYGGGQCAFSYISDGLTDTQATDFYTCVQTFQTTLSRQV
jgi:hypothetical protein